VSVAGEHPEALKLLGEALAMLDALGKPDHLLAVNAHILSGMSLEELARRAEATRHYVRAADIVDRALPDREALAVLALTLAAEAAVRDAKPAAAIEHLERALRLHDRARSAPAARAKTQLRLAELLRHTDPARARALAESASLAR
jgi:tetratricopeptide (TPR) repeat protein